MFKRFCLWARGKSRIQTELHALCHSFLSLTMLLWGRLSLSGWPLHCSWPWIKKSMLHRHMLRHICPQTHTHTPSVLAALPWIMQRSGDYSPRLLAVLQLCLCMCVCALCSRRVPAGCRPCLGDILMAALLREQSSLSALCSPHSSLDSLRLALFLIRRLKWRCWHACWVTWSHVYMHVCTHVCAVCVCVWCTIDSLHEACMCFCVFEFVACVSAWVCVCVVSKLGLTCTPPQSFMVYIWGPGWSLAGQMAWLS